MPKQPSPSRPDPEFPHFQVTQSEFCFRVAWGGTDIDRFGSRHFAQLKADQLNEVLDRLLTKFVQRHNQKADAN